MRTRFWTENLKRRDQLEDLGIDGDNIRMYLVEIVWKVWTGFARLKTGTNGGLLLTG
jgi:hypothetical protein